MISDDNSRTRIRGSTSPDLSIVIVNWNARAHVERCLQSVFRVPFRHSVEVIVVDNNSSDDSRAVIRSRFPRTRLICNSVNAGFARATNQGVEAARARYVLLLNSDTIVDTACLDALVEFMDVHPEAGAAGGRLLNFDGSFQAGYADFPSIGQDLLIATGVGALRQPGYPSHKVADSVRAVDWISAACLLVRRSCFLEAGALDEDYFMYGEEVDLQFRLKRRGWLVYYLPEVLTMHLGGASSDRWNRRKRVYRGKILFYRKNYTRCKAGVLRLGLGLVSLAKLCVWTPVCAVPRALERARREWRSNWEVLGLCLRFR